MKKEITNFNKALIAISFTFAMFVLVNLKNDVFWINLFGTYIYILAGFLLPVVLLKGNIRVVPLDKDSVATKFVILSSISVSILFEVISFYITPSYYQKLSNNILFDTFFPFNLLLELGVVLIIFMYYSKITELLQTQITKLYAYSFCVIVFAILSNMPVKNLLLACFIFYILHYIENENYALLSMTICTIVSVIFRYMCYFYINFGIAHYFILLFMIACFILFERCLNYAERMLLRREFEKIEIAKPNNSEKNIFWILCIFIGIYFVIY